MDAASAGAHGCAQTSEHTHRCLDELTRLDAAQLKASLHAALQTQSEAQK